MDAARVRNEQAGGEAHQRRLAGAVRADQSGDGAGRMAKSTASSARMRSVPAAKVFVSRSATRIADVSLAMTQGAAGLSWQGSVSAASGFWSRRMLTVAGMHWRSSPAPSQTKTRVW